jgi:hypothetical protein
MKPLTKLLTVLVIGFAIVGVVIRIALPTRAKEKVSVQVVVSPDLYGWAEANAREFNARHADAQVTVKPIDGLSAIDEFVETDTSLLPHAWIPEATFVTAIAQDRGLPFETTGQSMAASDIVWGSFSSREGVLVEKFGALDWQAVHEAAVSESWGQLGGNLNWGYFKLAIASPTHSTEGLAALLSAVATYHNQSSIESGDIDGACLNWLLEVVSSVPNFNTLGPEPAKSMAARGPSIGDVGLLSAAAWNRSESGLNKWGVFVTANPEFTMRLDYPYILRSDLEDDAAEQEMVQRFGDHLLIKRDQLEGYGFDGNSTVSATLVQADVQAALALLRWAQREGVGH